jgi:Protein of unknown function (DUF2845)
MKSILLLFLLLLPGICSAFFCPNNFNQINIGDSIDQVLKACGTPNNRTERKVEAEGPQEWNYFVQQNVYFDALNQAQGTLKTSVTFDASGKAINISVNGIGVGASAICGGNIQLGDTRDTIKQACGTPTFINKQTTGNEPPPTKIVELTYSSTKLIFENGRLKERQ